MAAPIVALANAGDRSHHAVAAVLAEWPGDLVIPAPVTAEIDFLLGRRCGRLARLAFLDDLARGRFGVASLDAAEHMEVRLLEERYAELDLGLADCSIIALARRLETRTVLSFDERHLRAVQPLQGGTFTLLPADA
ncbi:MAG: type II toxin-antitoxin system VapC family toxin [Egibacteraceae bacterium]